ncbi:MAG: citrate (Si)-synthase [Saprospiraceae bacterium]
MDHLKEKFKEKAFAQFTAMRAMLKEHGDKKVDEVKISQIFGGARGVKTMVWDTSQLDAVEGIRFRGYSIPELRELLPKVEGGKEPMPEGLFHLMLIGEVPTKEEADFISREWSRRATVPAATLKVLDSLSPETHPMIQFIIAVNSMSDGSVFSTRYADGMSKSDYWDATYEDTMNLLARLPRIAAYIFRRSFFDGKHIEADESLDWAGNFAHMLGVSDDPTFKSLMRLYLTIHADHEGGNASAHTAHLIGSTLSDAYLSFAGGLNSLAGPLHGLANQEVIKWITEMVEKIGTDEPTKEQIATYVNETLAQGKVIPGYGHAVLRQPDPRFTAQRVFAEEYIPDGKMVNVVWKGFEVIPDILAGLGKVKNPWPNVDAHSGAILVHYGMDQFNYYTVLFGVSRAMGVLAQMCWSRAMGFALERPKSVTTEWVENFVKKA